MVRMHLFSLVVPMVCLGVALGEKRPKYTLALECTHGESFFPKSSEELRLICFQVYTLVPLG